MVVGSTFARVAVCLSLICIQGTLCAPSGFSSDDGSDVISGQGASMWLGIVGGCAFLVVLVVVIAVCAEPKRVNPHVRRDGPPTWTQSLTLRPEMNGGFTDVSEGIHNITPYHIQRERLGVSVTDAARWSQPLTEGKHVFEVHWPQKKNRGSFCCIGVATAEVKLSKQGRCSLVGEHSQSWGLDLARHRSFHKNVVQQRLALSIPDKFFAYFDIDSGKIGFSDDVATYGYETEFFGYVCHGIPKSTKPLYMMVSCCSPGEQIQVYYRGSHVPSGGFGLVETLMPPPPPTQEEVEGVVKTDE